MVWCKGFKSAIFKGFKKFPVQLTFLLSGEFKRVRMLSNELLFLVHLYHSCYFVLNILLW